MNYAKINDKCHVTVLRQFSIGFAGVVNMRSPYWRGVTVKHPHTVGPGFKPHDYFCKTGKLAQSVQTNKLPIGIKNTDCNRMVDYGSKVTIETPTINLQSYGEE